MRINNKIFKPFGVLLLSVLFLTSCNDEPVNMVESSFGGNGLKVITYNNGGNGKTIAPTTIATFDSQLTYDNYIDDLDTQVEIWDDAFVAQWNHLDDDALDAKEEELGFDSEKPLTDFENQVGLQSLRQQYLAEEEVWLNNEELNDATDPSNKPEYDFDSNEMTVLNKYAEVQIGTTIIKQLSEEEISTINEMKRAGGQKNIRLIDDGAFLTIQEEDYNALAEFNDGNTSVIEQDNVEVVQSSTSSCSSWKSKPFTDNYSSGKKVKLRVKFRNFAGVYFKAKAKIISYKKRRNRWKRKRIQLGVDVATNTFCEEYYPTSTSIKRKRRKKLKRTITRWGAGSLKAMSTGESVIGGFEYGGKSGILRLTW